MKRILYLIIILLIITGLVDARPDKMADKIIKKYVKKIGGQRALNKIKILSYTYEMNHQDEKKVMKRKIVQKRPNKVRFEYESGEVLLAIGKWYYRGKVTADGEKREWSTGEYSSDTYILYRLGGFLDYKKRGLNVEFAGEAIISGKQVEILKLIRGKEVRRYYFDYGSGLLVQFKPAKGVKVKVGGYRKVGKVLFPTRTEGTGTLPNGRKWHHINTMKDIKINPKINESLFNPPLNKPKGDKKGG
jgi:hypothetical protein